MFWLDSTTITVIEIVIREIPPSIAAAPTGAHDPGDSANDDSGATTKLADRRPSEAPDMIAGTKGRRGQRSRG